MSGLFLPTEAQMRRIEPYFPLLHGVPRVDYRRVISGVVFVIKNGLRWRDAPKYYGPHKTIHNRCVRWSRLGVFDKIFTELEVKGTLYVTSLAQRFRAWPVWGRISARQFGGLLGPRSV